MQAKHGNGNGHGKSLAIEAQRLLPTPTTEPSTGNGHARNLGAEARLLPTPRTSDTNGSGAHGTGGPDLRTVAATLLPTPRATDGTKGGPNQRGSSGDLMLPSAVQLLPTPRASEPTRSTDDHAPTLGQVVTGTPHLETDRPGKRHLLAWGDYAPAIARWEHVIGRPAPAPTEPGPKGNPRLSAAFVEWLMGLPEGHVTGVDIPRNAMLKALGNGVVPQQSAAACRWWLTQIRSAAA